MFEWPFIKFASSSSGITPPLIPGDNGETLPDYYRFLDPLYSKRKFKPLNELAPESYFDDEGRIYHSTYRFFPTIVPRNKRLPPEERPAYFQSFWDQVPEPEFRTPSQSPIFEDSRQAREGTDSWPHERTRLLFKRLSGGLDDDDGRVSMSILIRLKKLFRSFMAYIRCRFRDEPLATSVV